MNTVHRNNRQRGPSGWLVFGMIAAFGGIVWYANANPPQQYVAPQQQYAAGLRQQMDPADRAHIDERFDRLEAMVARLEATIAAAIEPEAPVPPAAVPKAPAPEAVPPRSAKPDGLQLLANFCVRCHHETVAETKGKGLVLVSKDNKLLIDADLAAKCLEMIESGAMPKKVAGVPQPSDDERLILVKMLAGLKQRK